MRSRKPQRSGGNSGDDLIGNLTDNKIFAILSSEYNKKKKPDKPASIKLKPKLISRFFSHGQKQVEIEEVIKKALTLYFERLKETEGH